MVNIVFFETLTTKKFVAAVASQHLEVEMLLVEVSSHVARNKLTYENCESFPPVVMNGAQQIPLVRFSFVHFTLQAGYFIKLPLTNGKKQHQTLHPSGMTLLYKRDLLHSV